jgi:hypothetical protein
MATWQDVRNYLEWSFSDETAGSVRPEDQTGDPDDLVLLLNLPNGHRQKVVVRRFDAGSHEWVEIATIVCYEHQLPARDALIKNNDMALGHLALAPESGKYWFRHTLWLPGIDPEKDWGELPVALALIMSVGDYIEQTVTGEDLW